MKFVMLVKIIFVSSFLSISCSDDNKNKLEDSFSLGIAKLTGSDGKNPQSTEEENGSTPGPEGKHSKAMEEGNGPTIADRCDEISQIMTTDDCRVGGMEICSAVGFESKDYSCGHGGSFFRQWLCSAENRNALTLEALDSVDCKWIAEEEVSTPGSETKDPQAQEETISEDVYQQKPRCEVNCYGVFVNTDYPDNLKSLHVNRISLLDVNKNIVFSVLLREDDFNATGDIKLAIYKEQSHNDVSNSISESKIANVRYIRIHKMKFCMEQTLDLETENDTESEVFMTDWLIEDSNALEFSEPTYVCKTSGG